MSPGIISFTVPGRIGGKGRARAFVHRNTGKITAMTPKRTRADEGVVRHFAAQAMGYSLPLQGALHISVKVWRQHPARWSLKQRKAATYITGKPDCDNVLKLLADAMNGIVYRDDAQIAVISFERRYDSERQESTFVHIQELEAINAPVHL